MAGGSRIRAAQRRTFGDTIGSIVSFIVTLIKRMLLINDPTRRSANQRRSLDDVFQQIASFITTMVKRIFLITDPARRSFNGNAGNQKGRGGFMTRRQDEVDESGDNEDYEDDGEEGDSEEVTKKPDCANGMCNFIG
jgi:hypothetical protein